MKRSMLSFEYCIVANLLLIIAHAYKIIHSRCTCDCFFVQKRTKIKWNTYKYIENERYVQELIILRSNTHLSMYNIHTVHDTFSNHEIGYELESQRIKQREYSLI